MPKQRITASKVFAWQMAQACLRDPMIPRELRLNGLWMHMEMEMDSSTYSVVSMLIAIHGAPCQVRANFKLQRSAENEMWTSGSCVISTTENRDRKWKFLAHIEDNQLVVELTGHPDLATPEYEMLSPGPGPAQHD